MNHIMSIVKERYGRYMWTYQYQPRCGTPTPKFFFSYNVHGSRQFALKMAYRHRHIMRAMDSIGMTTQTLMRLHVYSLWGEGRWLNKADRKKFNFIRKGPYSPELDCNLDFNEYEYDN